MKQYKNRNWLNQKYSIEEFFTNQIGKLCNCSYQNIQYWLIKLKIPMRSRSKANHLKMANNCNLSNEAKQWIDGEWETVFNDKIYKNK